MAAAAFIGFKFHYIKTSNDKHLQTFNNYYYNVSSISKFAPIFTKLWYKINLKLFSNVSIKHFCGTWAEVIYCGLWKLDWVFVDWVYKHFCFQHDLLFWVRQYHIFMNQNQFLLKKLKILYSMKWMSF